MLEAQILVMCAGVRILLQNIGRQGACRFVLFRVCLWLSFPRFLPGLTGRPVEDSRHSQQTKLHGSNVPRSRATRGGTPIAQLVRRLLG